ncbi:hypothetical protein GALL_103320 [mine drainage metagenome]|uniref:Uncharacterized protein n=1 Tax=mine drainage metagenome TaxID=410659 RepID=A0A1J5SIE2_9ZZZZ
MINKLLSKEQLSSIIEQNGYEKDGEFHYSYTKNYHQVLINKNGVLCVFNKKNGKVRETSLDHVSVDIQEMTGEELHILS